MIHVNYITIPEMVNNHINVQPDFMPKSSVWSILNRSVHSVSFESYDLLEGSEVVGVQFQFTFKRNHIYYLLNVITPGILLSVLLLASFFISPKTADRISYSATIMLSMFVVQSTTLSYLPVTAEPTLIVMYTFGECVFGAVCTLHAGVLCWFCSNKQQIAMKKITKFQFSTIGFIDFISFMAFTLTWIVFNIATLIYIYCI